MKTLFRILFLLIGLALLGYSGNSIYQKQKFKVTHNSFKTKNDQSVFIPNIKYILEKPNAKKLIEAYGVPEKATKFLKKIAVKIHKSKLVNAQINFNETFFLISLTGEGLMHMAGAEIEYRMFDKYAVYSEAKKIKINYSAKNQTYKGNADFFFIGLDQVVESVKLTDNFKYSTYFTDDEILKGSPVNVQSILTICPTIASEINFYGSSRLIDDAETLFNTNNKDQLNWIENGFAHVKKDSFEILIAKQNDMQSLKYLLQEATLSQVSDSLLLPSIFLNNTEIIPFKTNWKWKEIYPFLSHNLSYYSAYNNYVFVANSLPAMYWLLKQIQLGKTYKKNVLDKIIPMKTNVLSIYNVSGHLNISFKTWVQKSMCFNANASSNFSKESKLKFSEFNYPTHVYWLEFIKVNTGDLIVILDDKSIALLDKKGNQKWSIPIANPELTRILVDDFDQDGDIDIMFNDRSKMYIVSLNGKTKNGFPIKLSTEIQTYSLIRYESNSRLLINDGKQVLNYSLAGKIVDGWLFSNQVGQTKSLIYHQNHYNQHLIYFSTQSDSIFVLNRKGEVRLKQKLNLNFDSNQIFLTKPTSSNAPLQLLSYSKGYILNMDIKTGYVDSLKIDINIEALHSYWINVKGEDLLAFEGFDKVLFFNQLGVLEFSIIKPESNSNLLITESINDGTFMFLNSQANLLYLLDEYGNLIYKKPLDGDGVLSFSDGTLVSKLRNKISIYNLK